MNVVFKSDMRVCDEIAPTSGAVTMISMFFHVRRSVMCIERGKLA